LLNMINVKREINKIVFLLFEELVKILNSWFNFLKIKMRAKDILFCIIQNRGVIKIINANVLIQFSGKEKKEEGSKTENKFVIIVN